MALDLGTKTITVKDRTVLIEFSTPLSGAYSIRIARQKVWLDETGALISSENAPDVMRMFADIAAQSFTVGDLTLTGAQIAGLLAGVADLLRQEDITAAVEG
jgi:hypothetical protein